MIYHARRAWRHVCYSVGLTVSVTLVAALMCSPSTAHASPRGRVTCKAYALPVALSPAQAPGYFIWGELCATPAELIGGATVQLLIHGATYSHLYWDFGVIHGVRYSYARDLAAAGIPTFAIDEIGVGRSSHPPSADVTIPAAAYVAHQMVQYLRDGAIAHTRFDSVIAVGHSFGSITTILEAATYHDVAGVILTASTHSDVVFHAVVKANEYPAIDDPQFADSGLDPGYLTTRPGTRGLLFYNLADADPAVVAADEAGKDVFSETELVTGLPLLTSNVSLGIDVPVLVIDGTKDQLDCGVQVTGGAYDCSSGLVIAREEAPYYAAAAQLRACAIPDAGHDIALSLNHVLQEVAAIQWSYEYVGQVRFGRLHSRVLPADCN